MPTIESALAAAAESAEGASNFSLPKGVEPANVQRRIDQLVLNGADPLLARQMAIEAETLQVRRDALTVASADNKPAKK
jgi:hypothetical protein